MLHILSDLLHFVRFRVYGEGKNVINSGTVTEVLVPVFANLRQNISIYGKLVYPMAESFVY
jgi:hypothetical protein